MSSSKPSAAQIRGALGLLNWENKDLAKACGVTPQSISNIKNGATRAQPKILDTIARVFDGNGIEFTESDGVRKKPDVINILSGTRGLNKFLDNVYEYLKEHGGKVMVTGVLDEQWTNYGGEHIKRVHIPRMVELCANRKDVEVLSLCPEGTVKFDYDSYTKYRAQPRKLFDAVPFYVYGDNLAIIIFQSDPPPKIILINSSVVADAYRHQFIQLWGIAKEIPKGQKLWK